MRGRGTVGYDKQRRTWYYRHDCPPDAGGKRRQKRARGFARKYLAEQALAESLWDTWRSGHPPPSITVAGWIAREIARKSPALSPVTAASYRRWLDDYVAARALGALPLAQLDQAAVAAWLAELCQALPSAVSVRSVAQVVSVHLRPLVKRGQIPPDTLEQILPKRGPVPLRVWTPEQTRRVIEAFAGDYLHMPLLLAVTTGLRAGELLALTWDKRQGNELIVNRSLAWVDKRPLVKEPKVERSIRRVTLYPEVLAALEQHRASQRRQKLAHPPWDIGERIFPAFRGGWWKPQALSTMYQVRLAKVDVPRLRWHDLRHTHASHLLAAGTDPATVAERLGDTLATIINTYGHHIPGRQDVAVCKGSTFLGLTQPRGLLVSIGAHVNQKPKP